tara:strand:- start:305 stop:964 length:660 start_codon:yes stop_codon:yes gene_type:complete
MSNFRTQIENLAGKPSFTTVNDSADYLSMLDNFLLQTSRNVLDVLDEDYILKNTGTLQISDGNGQDIYDKRVLKVLRNEIGCVEVPLEMKSKVTGTSSIYAPSVTSPVYYLESSTIGAKLFIKPDPTSSQKGTVHYIPIPSSISNTATTISNFPDEAEYAVVLGSAVRVIQHKLNILLHEDEDVELAQVIQNEMSLLNQMYVAELSRLSGRAIREEGAE